jgi:photosystem II stability/assembly factor-like uncharacterized protein
MLLVALAWLMAGAVAAEPPAALPRSPQPWHDDATLYDVQFAGTDRGYAVGAQGVVWRTDDAGRSWLARHLPEAVTLRSVSLLDEEYVVVFGTRRQPYTGVTEGVVYRTEDAGETWTERGRGQLPALVYGRAFSEESYLVVGQPTPLHPSGIHRTDDAGVTWKSLAGEAAAGWQTATFADPELGIVAGRNGRLAMIAGDQILPSRLPALGARTLRGLVIQGNDTGWLVGDGGLLLRTSTGGVVWDQPTTTPPEGFDDVCDLRTVAARGAHVWLAGHPGSVIWHSPDQGATWEAQPTGEPAPIERLKFVTETLGYAVGEFGVIIRTENGGRSWAAVRGGGRRAGWLAWIPTPEAAPREVAVKLSAEEGYRGVVWALSHAETTSPVAIDPRDPLAAMMHAAKANLGAVSWRLPLDRPDLTTSADGLLARWQVRAEQQAPNVLVRELVRQLRTYRPEVVLLPYAAEHDAVANLLQQGAQAALAQAGDETRALELSEVGRLAPWRVPRVYQTLAPGSQGELTLQPDEFLPRLGDALRNQTAPLGEAAGSAVVTSVAFRRVLPPVEGTASGGFFAGLDNSYDSAIRRPLVSITREDSEALRKQIQAQRNFRQIAARAKQDPQLSAQLVGQLPSVLRDLETDQQVVVLTDLIAGYRERREFEHAEGVALDLIRRHPNHPAAVATMAWLLKYWSSGEVAWQRLRGQGRVDQTASHNPDATFERIRQAGGLGSSFLVTPRNSRDAIQPTGGSATNPLQTRRNATTDVPPDQLEAWRRRAVELCGLIEAESPQLFADPAVQLPLAALRRATKSAGAADEIYRKFLAGRGETGPNALIEQELWLSQGTNTPPRQMAICRRTAERPMLDGVLSDPCWQAALESKLGTFTDEELTTTGFVLYAYDDEFFYLAASLRRETPLEGPIPEVGERDYDAELTGQDRIGFAVDVDRDYASWYQLEVDHRGQTRDACWEDGSFNPTWYVARQAELDRWQLEIAIPWSELVPRPPVERDIWAVSAVRTVPQGGYHGVMPNAVWPPRWDSLGLLRFE